MPTTRFSPKKMAIAGTDTGHNNIKAIITVVGDAVQHVHGAVDGDRVHDFLLERLSS